VKGTVPKNEERAAVALNPLRENAVSRDRSRLASS